MREGGGQDQGGTRGRGGRHQEAERTEEGEKAEPGQGGWTGEKVWGSEGRRENEERKEESAEVSSLRFQNQHPSVVSHHLCRFGPHRLSQPKAAHPPRDPREPHLHRCILIKGAFSMGGAKDTVYCFVAFPARQALPVAQPSSSSSHGTPAFPRLPLLRPRLKLCVSPSPPLPLPLPPPPCPAAPVSPSFPSPPLPLNPTLFPSCLVLPYSASAPLSPPHPSDDCSCTTSAPPSSLFPSPAPNLLTSWVAYVHR